MLKRKITFLALYFLSPAIPVIAIHTSNAYKYSNNEVAASMAIGAIAYTWLIAQLILAARPKFIEKYFGLDKLYRFHGLMAVVSLSLAFIHRTIEIDMMGMFLTGEIGDKAWLLLVAVVILALVFMADTIVMKIKPIRILRSFAARVGIARYQYQVAIHNLTVIALVLLLIHVLLTSSARRSPVVSAVYIVYFGIGMGFYVYHRVIRMILLNKNRYTVREVSRESTNMWTIKLAPEKGRIFDYKAGQYAFLRLFGVNVKPEEHPFSISSHPSNRDYLSFTIKELGDYTSKIGSIQSGCKAFVDGPYGRLCHADYPSEEGIVMIAGGVGITPMLSMLRQMRSQEKDRRVVLIWGVNNRHELICSQEFNEMLNEMKNFRFVPVMFKDEEWEGEKGIIDDGKILAILNKNRQDIHSNGYYICGPDIMMRTVIKGLKKLGIRRRNIRFERFSL